MFALISYFEKCYRHGCAYGVLSQMRPIELYPFVQRVQIVGSHKGKLGENEPKVNKNLPQLPEPAHSILDDHEKLINIKQP